MSATERVAVVGLGCVYPGAPDVETFWDNIVAGRDAITDAPPDRIDPQLFANRPGDADHLTARRGGFVQGEALTFEPGRFGIMPITVEGAEPDQMLALKTAAAAIDDAGGLDDVAHERIGVVLGRGSYLTPQLARLDQRVRTANQLLDTLRGLLPEVDDDRLVAVKDAFTDQLGEFRPESAIGLVPNLAASRIANRLDFGGPAFTVDAACASSLIAVDAAISELRSGRCDAVLAGGVHHCHDVTLWSVFSQLGALSPSGEIRPFSRDADGVLISEGTGILVLERLDDAVRRGHRVYATIGGAGVSSDGRQSSLMSPRVDGQVLALERAYRSAGIDPATVGLVEGHGTATPAGDRAELETLRCIYGKHDPIDGPRPVLGSVKSNIGHAMPAAGAAGLIKSVLAVHHGVLPPTLHGDDPHPALADTRFRLLDQAEAWTSPAGPRRSGVNAFGFGGINAHVIVEQHGSAPTPTRAPAAKTTRTDDFRFDAILLEGRDAADLATQLAAIGPDRDPPRLPEGAGPARLAIVDPNPKRLELAARVLAKGQAWRGRNDVWFEPSGLVTGGGRVAFLFPGIEPTFDAELGDVERWFGVEAAPMPDGASGIERHGRQIFDAGRLLHHALATLGIAPDDIAGHSLGEWTGVFTAELIPADRADDFLDGLKPGSLELPGVVFVALGCGADVAGEVIAGLDGVVVSHDNCPHQSVICGPEAEIAEAGRRLAARKVLAQELPFRSGFHTPFFEPYLDIVRHHWGRMPLQAARTPLWSATTCEHYPTDADAVRRLAADHLVQPVRFRQLVEKLYDDGVRVFVQAGVGSLVAFADDTLKGRPQLSISAASPNRSGLGQLGRVAAAVWVEGVDVRLDALLAPVDGAAGGNEPTGGPTVQLALGTPRVELPAGLGLGLVPAADHEPATDWGAGTSAALRAEFDGLLADTLSATRSITAALSSRASAAPTDSTAPASEENLSVGIEAYPWLVDHCFYRQPDGWDDLSDRFPVLPMTTMVELLGRAAARLAPELTVTHIDNVRALRWLAGAPPTRAVLTARRVGPDRIEGAIEGYVRATVHLGPSPPSGPAAGGHAVAQSPPVAGRADQTLRRPLDVPRPQLPGRALDHRPRRRRGRREHRVAAHPGSLAGQRRTALRVVADGHRRVRLPGPAPIDRTHRILRAPAAGRGAGHHHRPHRRARAADGTGRPRAQLERRARRAHHRLGRPPLRQRPRTLAHAARARAPSARLPHPQRLRGRRGALEGLRLPGTDGPPLPRLHRAGGLRRAESPPSAAVAAWVGSRLRTPFARRCGPRARPDVPDRSPAYRRRRGCSAGVERAGSGKTGVGGHRPVDRRGRARHHPAGRRVRRRRRPGRRPVPAGREAGGGDQLDGGLDVLPSPVHRLAGSPSTPTTGPAVAPVEPADRKEYLVAHPPA